MEAGIRSRMCNSSLALWTSSSLGSFFFYPLWLSVIYLSFNCIDIKYQYIYMHIYMVGSGLPLAPVKAPWAASQSIRQSISQSVGQSICVLAAKAPSSDRNLSETCFCNMFCQDLESPHLDFSKSKFQTPFLTLQLMNDANECTRVILVPWGSWWCPWHPPPGMSKVFSHELNDGHLRMPVREVKHRWERHLAISLPRSVAVTDCTEPPVIPIDKTRLWTPFPLIKHICGHEKVAVTLGLINRDTSGRCVEFM